MTVKLLVQIEVQSGKAEEQITAFRRFAPLVRAEHGCLGYDLYRVTGYPERFILDETWLDQDSLDAHAESGHMIQADIANRSFRAGPAIAFELSPVESPDAPSPAAAATGSAAQLRLFHVKHPVH